LYFFLAAARTFSAPTGSPSIHVLMSTSFGSTVGVASGYSS